MESLPVWRLEVQDQDVTGLAPAGRCEGDSAPGPSPSFQWSPSTCVPGSVPRALCVISAAPQDPGPWTSLCWLLVALPCPDWPLVTKLGADSASSTEPWGSCLVLVWPLPVPPSYLDPVSASSLWSEGGLLGRARVRELRRGVGWADTSMGCRQSIREPERGRSEGPCTAWWVGRRGKTTTTASPSGAPLQ